MRAAPPVLVPVDAAGAAACVSAVSGLAATGCAAWAWGLAQWPGAWAAAGVAASLVGAASWRRLRGAGGRLAWDGGTWHWRGDTGDLRLMIDADAWMLLVFSPASGGRPCWLAASARGSAAAWHGLRAAVYCRASTPPR
jgi:hypothetical protein